MDQTYRVLCKGPISEAMARASAFNIAADPIATREDGDVVLRVRGQFRLLRDWWRTGAVRTLGPDEQSGKRIGAPPEPHMRNGAVKRMQEVTLGR